MKGGRGMDGWREGERKGEGGGERENLGLIRITVV